VSSRSWQLRVQDILDSITAIQLRTSQMSFANFERDEAIVKFVLYDFIIIGEAASNVPTEIQSRFPQIPWRLMSDMRNVVAHEYFQVNVERVWGTIQEDLSPLISQLEQLLVGEWE
jgi:uncharacterized protein with HEPN domain